MLAGLSGDQRRRAQRRARALALKRLVEESSSASSVASDVNTRTKSGKSNGSSKKKTFTKKTTRTIAKKIAQKSTKKKIASGGKVSRISSQVKKKLRKVAIKNVSGAQTLEKSAAKKSPRISANIKNKLKKAAGRKVKAVEKLSSVEEASSSSKKINQKKTAAKPRVDHRQMREITLINESQKKPAGKVPPIAKNTLRIIPIGGNEEVGRNMNVFEYENDIVIVDMGVQWPEGDMPGIDYIVPNVDYLKGKEKKIRAVIFTHGHLDHIGAAPILLKQLGYPPIVARDLTLALVKKKMEDYDPGSVSRLKTVSIKDVKKPLRLGKITAKFFEVEHSIMDSMGVALETPVGTPIHMGDWTINHDPAEGEAITYEHLAKLPSPKILMLESLGAIKVGKAPSEKIMKGNLEKLIDEAPGRLIIGTFASQVKRIGQLLQYAQKIGKKVALDGYSMRTNVEIAQQLGYLKVRKDVLIPISEISKYPDNKIIILCTGAQGESNASLTRIVTDNHRFIKLQRNDTIVFSSSIIPGNERVIQRLKDNLYRKCDNVIHSDIMETHIGGHSVAGDIQEVIKMIKPDFFLPVYANHFMLKEAAKRAMEIGFPKDRIFVLDNGQVLEFSQNSKPKLLTQRADASYVFVDGLGVGDIGHVVLRDRKVLSEDGMYVITVMVDGKTKRVVGNMQITSRGFIFVKENFDLVNQTKEIVKKAIRETTSKSTKMDWRATENAIRDQVGEFLFQKTQRRPMVLPVVVEV